MSPTTLLQSYMTAPLSLSLSQFRFSNTLITDASLWSIVQVCSSTPRICHPISILYLFIDPYRRTVYGRAVNASCSTYLFPADTVESQRMSM